MVMSMTTWRTISCVSPLGKTSIWIIRICTSVYIIACTHTSLRNYIHMYIGCTCTCTLGVHVHVQYMHKVYTCMYITCIYIQCGLYIYRCGFVVRFSTPVNTCTCVYIQCMWCLWASISWVLFYSVCVSDLTNQEGTMFLVKAKEARKMMMNGGE